MEAENKTNVSHDILEQQKSDNKSDLLVVYNQELLNASTKALDDIKLLQKRLNIY